MGFNRGFKLQSGGAAYNLDVGFVPDVVRIFNYTKWATDNTNVEFTWFRQMGDGYALAGQAEDDGINRAIITSDGVTAYDTTSFQPSAFDTVSGATQAKPVVITTAAVHGASSGQQGRFSNVLGMVELNQTTNPYQITVLSTTTFSLQNLKGEDIDGTGFTAYSSGGSFNNLSKERGEDGFKGITLGTSVVGADGDVLYVQCYQNNFSNEDLGDIG